MRCLNSLIAKTLGLRRVRHSVVMRKLPVAKGIPFQHNKCGPIKCMLNNNCSIWKHRSPSNFAIVVRHVLQLPSFHTIWHKDTTPPSLARFNSVWLKLCDAIRLILCGTVFYQHRLTGRGTCVVRAERAKQSVLKHSLNILHAEHAHVNLLSWYPG
jgi:hypothetical protein